MIPPILTYIITLLIVPAVMLQLIQTLRTIFQSSTNRKEKLSAWISVILLIYMIGLLSIHLIDTLKGAQKAEPVLQTQARAFYLMLTLPIMIVAFYHSLRETAVGEVNLWAKIKKVWLLLSFIASGILWIYMLGVVWF